MSDSSHQIIENELFTREEVFERLRVFNIEKDRADFDSMISSYGNIRASNMRHGDIIDMFNSAFLELARLNAKSNDILRGIRFLHPDIFPPSKNN